MSLKKIFGNWEYQILIALITLLLIHLLFHMNERYNVADYKTTYLANASREMYYEFIGRAETRNFYVQRTSMRYFDYFPDWSINVIYIGYWILGFWYLYNYANKKKP